MSVTNVRVVFPEVEFAGNDVKSARVIEEFSPLSITIPITTLELTLYSSDLEFSIINPSGKYSSLVNHQPMVVYETVNGVESYVGQFYLDDWQSQTENLKKFKCVDIMGILDKYDYMGGMWETPVTVGELVADILGRADVSYEIDPDLAAQTLTGWIPICSYREALQQVLFASGAFILIPRTQVPIIGTLAQVEIDVSGARIRPGTDAHFHAGVTRTRQRFFRPSQTIVYSSGNAVTRGMRSGVFKAGTTRVRQHWFRQGQWAGIKPVYEIPDRLQSGRKLTLRPQVTGVEVVAHDIIRGTGTNELFNGTLDIGDHEIRFSQPMHDLVLTAKFGSITQSGANYAIITMTQADPVVLSGQVYVDTQKTFAQYITGPVVKENILRVSQGALVNSNNATAVCEKLFNYYQQRYVQNVKFFSTSLDIGSAVNMQTLYNNNLFGVIEKMSTNLTGGNIADMEIVGIITGQFDEGNNPAPGGSGVA